jgi:Protein of unknown function (DUF4031)
VTVYADDMQARFVQMIMCHMIADTDEELHRMADAIGVSRRWHQAPPQHDSHYDIAMVKRAMAIAAAATPHKPVVCPDDSARSTRRPSPGCVLALQLF